MESVAKNFFGFIIVVIIVYWVWYAAAYLFDPSTMTYSNWMGTETDEKVSVRASATIRIGKYMEFQQNKEREVLFVGGTHNQADVFLAYNKTTRRLEVMGVLKKPNDVSTIGAAVGDMNGDGYEDLVLIRSDGVYIYYQNTTDDGVFAQHEKIYTPNEKENLGSVSLGDINLDGSLEIYVGVHTKTEFFDAFQFSEENTQPNLLLKKDVNGYTNIADVMGVQGDRNTWTASFVDLSGNGYPDIVVANDEGPVLIYRNEIGKSFSKVETEFPTGFWMGMAVGDFFNSGHQSMFFTNSGDTISTFMMKMMGADPELMPDNFTSDHIMIENKGNYEFEVVKDNGINGNYKSRAGFGWGAISMDFALDGNQSVVYSNNWKNIPWHKMRLLRDDGTVLQNLGDGTFARRSYFKNPHFSMTPIALDLNGNGIKDLVWINNNYYMIGYLNGHGSSNNWINVSLPKTPEFANAQILVEDASGRVQSQQNIMGGTGLCSSRSSIFQFGFGDEIPKILKIVKARGKPIIVDSPNLFETYNVLA